MLRSIRGSIGHSRTVRDGTAGLRVGECAPRSTDILSEKRRVAVGCVSLRSSGDRTNHGLVGSVEWGVSVGVNTANKVGPTGDFASDGGKLTPPFFRFLRRVSLVWSMG